MYNNDEHIYAQTYVCEICCLISGVSGTVRQCNKEGNGAKRCATQSLAFPAGENRKIESPSGQNEVCICYEDLCNNSPWLDWTKPTSRHTTHRPATREQAVVTTEN